MGLSPAGRVMSSRNSNRYVYFGGRFGGHEQALPTREREAYGDPTLVPTCLTGSMDVAHTASRAGDFFFLRRV